MEEQDVKVVPFSENPNLPLKIVTTAKGISEYRSLCRKIGDEYFIKGIDCVEVSNTWYRIDSGLVALNCTDGTWFLVSRKPRNMITGIVGWDAKNRIPKQGFFVKDPYNTVTVLSGGNTYECISQEAALTFCKEIPSRGIYIPANETSLADLRAKNVINNQNNQYNAEDDAKAFARSCELYKDYPLPVSKAVKKYSKYLGDITFGTEIECIRGYLSQHLRSRAGVIICRDGSLKDPRDETQGPEYTTVPYSGAKGVQTLINLARQISERNEIDEHCSLHIHIGNLPTTRMFIVAFYILCYIIQDDMFKMFPYYKNDEVKFAKKNKNYCQKLDKFFMLHERNMDKECCHDFINDTYIRIYKFLLEKTSPSKKFNRKNRRHPSTNKWERHSRYHWINLINLITSNRNTVEFRLHTATTNPQKIITWLFMCNALVKTAMFRTNDIIRGNYISIRDVFNYYADFYKTPAAHTISGYLNAYYDSRCEKFKKDFEAGDYLSDNDIQTDNRFSLDFSHISEMFK